MIKFCHYIKINSFYNKYNICAFNKDIEGNPFIIRFKTKVDKSSNLDGVEILKVIHL